MPTDTDIHSVSPWAGEADALLEPDSAVYCLSRENLDIINERKPALASKLYRTVSRMLAQPLTDTTSELRELER